MNIPDIFGWLGVCFSVSISIPQLIKSLRTKSTRGVSISTYRLIIITSSCYMVKCIDLGEPIFIVSNCLTLSLAITMLFLFKRYKGRK